MASTVRPAEKSRGPLAVTLLIECRSHPRCPVCGVLLHPQGVEFRHGFAFCVDCVEKNPAECQHIGIFWPATARLNCWRTTHGLHYYAVSRPGVELWPFSDECTARGLEYHTLFDPLRNLIKESLARLQAPKP